MNPNGSVGLKRATTFVFPKPIVQHPGLSLDRAKCRVGLRYGAPAAHTIRDLFAAPELKYLQESTKAVERLQAWYSPSTGLTKPLAGGIRQM